MRKIFLALGALAGFAIIAYIVLTISLYPDQRKRDQEYVKGQLLPIANHIIAFRDSHGRLPSDSEFRKWSDVTYENKLIDYYTEKPKFIQDWGKPGFDFLIGTWRGEWIHYYCSWNGHDFPDPK